MRCEITRRWGNFAGSTPFWGPTHPPNIDPTQMTSGVYSRRPEWKDKTINILNIHSVLSGIYKKPRFAGKLPCLTLTTKILLQRVYNHYVLERPSTSLSKNRGAPN